MSRILFVLKLGTGYNGYGHSPSGLLNSATFLVDMLNANGQTAKLVSVVDNNDIDREVHNFKPQVVVVEALWVIPEKFDVLTKLHPTVKWIVRGHSDIPFLASEGVAVDWFTRYLNFRNVSISFNSPKVVEDFKALVAKPSKVIYLPNYYPTTFLDRVKPADNVLRIGCFGAIRPMKNQLLQAIAAVQYADETREKLEFHINSTRVDDGAGVLKNLRSLFANTRHKLIEHPWMPHTEFLKVVRKMDVVLAVSMSETFCITAADAVAVGVPLICSDEIPWASDLSTVPVTDADAIIDKLDSLGGVVDHFAGMSNRRNLRAYSKLSKRIWLDFLSPNSGLA